MRELLKRLLKMVAGYGAVQWAGPFLSLIFTPIITRVLDPSDYGIADFALTVASAAGTVALFALPQALTAHFNDQPDDKLWQRRLIGSTLVTALAMAIPVGCGLGGLAPAISTYAFKDARYAHLFLLIGGSVIFGVCSSVLTTAAQAALRVRWGMVFSAIAVLGTVFGNVFYIVILRWGATGMVLTPITVGVLTTVAALWLMKSMIGPPDPPTVKLVLRSGLILFPTLVAAWVLQVVDRFFLVRYVSTTELGYYAIANKITSLLSVGLGPFLLAWTPLALAIQHDPTAKERYALMARYLIGLALAAGLGLGLFAPELLLILTRPAYLPAAPYVGFLAYVYVFNTVNAVLYTSALAGKQLGAVSWMTMLGAGVNIALNFWLIPTLGLWGGTMARVAGYAVPIIGLYFVLRRRFPVPYPVAALLGAFAVQAGLLLVSSGLPSAPLVISLLRKGALFGVLFVAFVGLGIITRYELKQAWLVVRRQLGKLFSIA